MQFSLLQKDLSLISKTFSKTLNKKSYSSSLAGVFIEAKGKTVTFSVTDLAVGLKIILPAQIKEEGIALVSGKVFLETIGFFEQEETVFQLREKELLLKNGRDKVGVSLLEQDFPPMEFIQEKKQEIELSFLENLVKRVAFVASNDQARPALTGVLLKGEGTFLQAVCTDGFRLATWEEQTKNNFFHEKNIIVSAKALIDLVSLLQTLSLEKVFLSYSEEEEKIFVFSKNFFYFTKLINSNYPPFEKIIPLEFVTKIKIDKQELIGNLNKAAIFSRTSNNTVKLEIDNKKIGFFASSLSEGVYQSELDLIESKGEELKISFNIRYLLDFFNLMSGETVEIGFNGHDRPALMKDLDVSDWQYVVMPFKSKG